MIVPIAEAFRSYAEPALTRLRYVYPTARFTLIEDGIELGGEPGIPEEAISREIHYALYREKIYAETLSMRQSLIEALTRR